MAQGSRDALEALLESDPIDDLAWTRHANPQAYRLVTQLRRYYRRELSHRGLTSPEAITVYYETVRLELLMWVTRADSAGRLTSPTGVLLGLESAAECAPHVRRESEPADRYLESPEQPQLSRVNLADMS